jgi:Big-like domain-containing protein
MRTALALALLVLAACDYDPAGRCDTSADCPAGQACGGGVCAPPAAAPPNEAPTAGADAYDVPAAGLFECAAAGGVLANDADPDGDPLVAERVGASATAHGLAFLEPSGAFRYLLTDSGYAGTDAFSYRASDGALRSSPATVTLTILPPP